MSQRDNPITSGNGLVRAVPAAIKVLPNAAPTVTSAKVARRVRKAVVSSTARHQVALAAPGETRIRANGRMTSVEMPRIRRDDLSLAFRYASIPLTTDRASRDDTLATPRLDLCKSFRPREYLYFFFFLVLKTTGFNVPGL